MAAASSSLLSTAFRRSSSAYSSYLIGGLACAATTGGILSTTEQERKSNNTVQCEQANSKPTSSLKTRMTLIGRFSLQSETASNPSLPCFFIGLIGTKPFTSTDFIQRWKERDMKMRHPRFHLRVSETSPGHFESTKDRNGDDDNVSMHVQDTLPPLVPRLELKYRLQHLLTDPLHVFTQLWQVQISSGGEIGSSGAISQHKCQQAVLEYGKNISESILLFRGHHVLADGVSLAAAFLELTDEYQEIQDMIHVEVQKRRNKSKNKSFWQKLALFWKRLAWWIHGSVMAYLHQLHLLLVTRSNPFDQVQRQTLLLSDSSDETTSSSSAARRSLSWCDATTVDEVKQVARALGPRVTVNDVWVSCISYAVSKQIQEHRMYLSQVQPDNNKLLQNFKHINVVIPVHLKGGMLLPGESLGNAIGAFTARVPAEAGDMSSSERLLQVHKSLAWVKQTPAPFLSYGLAKIASVLLPSSLNKRMFASINANACVAITNVRGSPKKLHICGRSVESTAGFLPLPPNIPIGCAVSSYAGVMSLSVTAEPWAVPDADKFLEWTLEEYQRLAKEVGVV